MARAALRSSGTRPSSASVSTIGVGNMTQAVKIKSRVEILDIFRRRAGEDWSEVRVGPRNDVAIRGEGFWYTPSSREPGKRVYE